MRQKVCLILITTTLEHQIRITQEAVRRIFLFLLKKKALLANIKLKGKHQPWTEAATWKMF